MGIELYPQSTILVFWRRCRPLEFQMEPSGVKFVYIMSNSVPASHHASKRNKSTLTAQVDPDRVTPESHLQ